MLVNEVEQKFLPQYYESAYVGPVDVDMAVQVGSGRLLRLGVGHWGGLEVVRREELVERVKGLLYALRHTASTAATLPSTHHGFVSQAHPS